MKTLAHRTAPVQHYAQFHEVYGIATLQAGGYLFQPDGPHDAWLVDYRHPDLMLFGLVALADAQHAADLARRAEGTNTTLPGKEPLYADLE